MELATLNRLGIILNLIGSFLVAPELIGHRRLSSLESWLQKSLAHSRLMISNLLDYASKPSDKWLYFLFLILPPVLIFAGVTVFIDKLSEFLTPIVGDNVGIMLGIIIICAIVAVIGVWFLVPLIIIIGLLASISLALAIVEYAIRIVSGHKVLRKFAVRFGIFLLITGALLQIWATYQ